MCTGTPKKVDVNGTPVFICCEGCRESLLAESEKYLAKLAASAKPGGPRESLPQMSLPQMELPAMGVPVMIEPQGGLPQTAASRETSEQTEEVQQALAKLSATDRALAVRQKTCPVADMPLGSMGTPIKVDVNGRPVLICCEGCRESLLANPAKYLAKLPKEGIR